MVPNEDKIIAYARRRGLIDPYIVVDSAMNCLLHGIGKDEYGWPLVWRVCMECHILRGGGANTHHQIAPAQFEEPSLQDIE